MSFSGSLQTLHFSEILQWCKSGERTGTLTVGRKGIRKDIFFEDGKIISAGSNDPREYLGQYLIALGKITEEQLNKAFAVQSITRILIGKILVVQKAITEDELENILAAKIMEMIFNIFLWQTGKFHFDEKKFSRKDRRIQIEIDIDHCIFEGARRVDEWKRCRAVFPSDRIFFIWGDNDPGDFDDKSMERRILGLVEIGKSIEEMCLELRIDSFTLLAQLFDLHRGGYIKGAGEKKKRKTAPAARKFRSPKEEKDYLYGNVLPSEKVPSLLKSLNELKGFNLTSEEAFILSRINGRWDIKSIVVMSPINELVILRIMKRLLDEKIITLA